MTALQTMGDVLPDVAVCAVLFGLLGLVVRGAAAGVFRAYDWLKGKIGK